MTFKHYRPIFIFLQDFRKENTELIKNVQETVCVCVHARVHVRMHVCFCKGMSSHMCVHVYICIWVRDMMLIFQSWCQCTLPQLRHQKRQHMGAVREWGVRYNSKQGLSWRVEAGDYGLWTCSAAISRHLSLPSSSELLAIWKQMVWVYTICSLSGHSRLSPAHLSISEDFSTPLTDSLSCYSHHYSWEL